MNKDLFKKGIQNIKDTKLTERERSLMFSKISEHMNSTSYVTKPTSLNWFVFLRQSTVFAALFLVIFSGTAVIVAADGSLPGDLLYPIKVNIKEPVVSAFALSKAQKVESETNKANERLKEAETLSEEGRLDVTTRKEIEIRFEKHVDKIDTFSKPVNSQNKMMTNKKTDERSDFEESVLRHTEALDKIKVDLPEDKKIEVEQFKTKILETVQNKKDKNNARKEEERKETKEREDNRKNDKGRDKRD